MNEQTQLLCTFTTRAELDVALDKIDQSYALAFNRIYILENIDDENQLVLTYNVSKTLLNPPLISTIAVHRKKQTNTIYTINAINKLIEANNNGILDKTFKINWAELKNCVLVTAYSKLKVVNTKLLQIIEL